MKGSNENYEDITVIIEMSAGNESVGNEWMEAMTFHKSATLQTVIDTFAKKATGRVIITIDQSSVEEKPLSF